MTRGSSARAAGALPVADIRGLPDHRGSEGRLGARSLCVVVKKPVYIVVRNDRMWSHLWHIAIVRRAGYGATAYGYVIWLSQAIDLHQYVEYLCFAIAHRD